MRVHASIPVLTLLAGIAVGAVLGVLLSGGPSAHNTTSGATPPAERVDGTDEQASPPENRRVAQPPSRDNNADDAPETASEAAPAPLDVESYRVSGRVEDPEGNGVGGVRFRWHPDLTDAFRDQPAAEDFPDDESFQAAVRAHMERLTQLKLQGPQDVFSADDGTLEIADSVAAEGWLELLDDSYVLTHWQPDDRMRVSSSRRFRIKICRGAVLEARVLIDGKDAEWAMLTFQYPAIPLRYVVENIQSPATIRVPVGEAKVTATRIYPEGKAAPKEVVIKAGERNRLKLNAAGPITLKVTTDLPPGNRAWVEVKPVSETLTDEQVAIDGSIDTVRQGHHNDDSFVFEPDSAGEYVLAVHGGDVLLAVHRVAVEPGANEVSITVPEPADMIRIVLRVSFEGDPIPDSWKPDIWTSLRVPEFLWSRTGNEFVWLIHADARVSVSAVAAVTFYSRGVVNIGIVTREFTPQYSQTLDFAFIMPVKLRVELVGVRPDMAGEFGLAIAAVGENEDMVRWDSAGEKVKSADGTHEWQFRRLQPGNYSVRIYWRAGMGVRESLSHTVRVAGDNSKARIDLPAFHVLSLELPKRTVRGLVTIRNIDDKIVANTMQSHDSPITHIRFLRTGDYTVEYTDREGREHSHQVTLDKDTVISP